MKDPVRFQNAYQKLQASARVRSQATELFRSGRVKLLQEETTPEEGSKLEVRVPGRPSPFRVQIWILPEESDHFCSCESEEEICSHALACFLALARRDHTPLEAPEGRAEIHHIFQWHLDGRCRYLRMRARRFGENWERSPVDLTLQNLKIEELDLTPEDYQTDVLLRGKLPHEVTEEDTLRSLLQVVSGTGRLWMETPEQKLCKVESWRNAPAGYFRTTIVRRETGHLELHPTEPPWGVRLTLGVVFHPEERSLALLAGPSLEQVRRSLHQILGWGFTGGQSVSFRLSPREWEQLMSQSHELSVVWRGEFPKIQETEEVPPVHLRIVCEATSLEIDPSHQLYLTPVIVRKKSDLSPRVERQSLSPQENQEISRMASELFREFRLRLEEPRELSWGLARELLQQLARAGWEVETRVPSLLLPPVYGDGTFERVTAESSNAGVTFKFSEGILSSGIWDQARREGWKEIPLRGESEFEWRWVPLAAFPKTEEQMERSRAFFERLRAWKGDSTSGLKLFALERDIQATGLQLETQDLRLDYQKFRSTLSGSSPRTKLPSIFSERVVLRPYQVEGIGWIQALHELGLGALLADDMGLGKSLQAMAQIRGNGERALILCPTSVLSSWQQQLQAFRPDLRVVVYHGMSRKWDSHAEVVLSSYGMLRVDAARFSEMWDLLVLDETQTLKNPESQISQATLTLRATRRLGLSGTPIENRVSDLWVPLQILVPGLVGSLSEFKAATQNDWDRTRLKGLLAPLILRRRKSEVLRDLPEKTEQILSVELGEKEREIYRYLLRSSKKEILAQGGENGVPILEVLEALMRLRQVVTDPALLPEGFLEDRWSEDSSKTKVFLEHLESSLEQGRNCLVFSQWTSYLDRLERSLQALKVPYLRLDGSTPNRGEVIRKFQDPAGPPVLLISLKAGGVGTTLTRADQVYLMDPWWNPAVEEQAMDRAHRIGQKNPVFVYRLQVSGTIEESLEELKRQKRDLAESWMSGRQESQVPHEEWLDLLRSLSE